MKDLTETILTYFIVLAILAGIVAVYGSTLSQWVQSSFTRVEQVTR